MLKRHGPVLVALLIIALSVAGALYFGGPSYRSRNTANQASNGDELSQSNIAPTKWNYVYAWRGEPLSNDQVRLDGYRLAAADIAAADFSSISRALGLGEDIRIDEYDTGTKAFESGAQVVESTDSEQPLEENSAVFQDPNAYQLAAYSNQTGWWYSLLSSGTWISEHQSAPPTEERAKVLAEDFFRSRNLLPTDAAGPYVRPRDIIAASMDQAGASEIVEQFVSVYFTREIDGLPVVDESGEPIAYLTVDFGSEEKILSASGPMRPAERAQKNTAIVGDRSEQVAWDELALNQWGPGRIQAADVPEGAEEKIATATMQTVDRTYLVIPSVQTGDELLEPAFRFRGTIASGGTNDPYPFNVIVPMSSASQYEEYLDAEPDNVVPLAEETIVEPN